jgi:cytochrome c peroxidase
MCVAKTLGFPVAGLALVSSVCVPLQPASAQSAPNDPLWWAPAAIAHAQKMRVFKDADVAAQTMPSTIPVFEAESDSSGKIATYQPGGPTTTSSNAFFQSLGTNGRSCFACHQPQTGWGVSAADVQARFKASSGADPIFRVFDGATCPSDKVTTLAEKLVAYKLLTGRGLIRIGLPLPPKAQFEITNVDDPYKCSNNPSIGTDGIYSFYRRPLPATNARFLTDIQWDGREPDLKSQAINAARIHEQAATAPTETQLSQIIRFESGIYTAQDFDADANSLYALFPVGEAQGKGHGDASPPVGRAWRATVRHKLQ